MINKEIGGTKENAHLISIHTPRRLFLHWNHWSVVVFGPFLSFSLLFMLVLLSIDFSFVLNDILSWRRQPP